MSVWFAENVSLPVMGFLGAAFSGVKVSVGEMALFTSAAYIAARFLVAALSRRKKARLKSALLSAARILAAYALSYLLIWLPVASAPRLDSESVAVDAKSVRELCLELSQSAHERYTYYDADVENVTQRVAAALYSFTGRESRAKISVWPEWMKALKLAGICLPWSGEALVRGDMPLVALPFVAAHESAHSVGYGTEYEANYAAYRALETDGGLCYSGTMYALYYSLERLKALSPADYSAVVADMDGGVFSDYATLAAFSRVDDAAVNGAAEAFLSLSGQEGTDSYSRVVELLLRDRGTLPAYEEYTQ